MDQRDLRFPETRRDSSLPVSLTRMPCERSMLTIRPKYFVDSDLPWLSALLLERERFVGRKRREWKARLADGLPIEAPHQKLLVALSLLIGFRATALEQWFRHA